MEAESAELVELSGGMAQVHWRRSLRARRVSLRLDPRDGIVIVTLPPRTARNVGVALLKDNAAWVMQRLAALPTAVRFEDGATVSLAGGQYRIRHVGTAGASTRRGAVWLKDDEIHVAGDGAFLRRRVTDFLRAEAHWRLSALVVDKAKSAQLRASRVTVKDTRTRWGSCTANGALAFSWRLVMAPLFVQDYVVAHEVAHLRHMNHGPAFWKLVEVLSPHVRPAAVWLRDEGARLLRVG